MGTASGLIGSEYPSGSGYNEHLFSLTAQSNLGGVTRH